MCVLVCEIVVVGIVDRIPVVCAVTVANIAPQNSCVCAGWAGKRNKTKQSNKKKKKTSAQTKSSAKISISNVKRWCARSEPGVRLCARERVLSQVLFANAFLGEEKRFHILERKWHVIDRLLRAKGGRVGRDREWEERICTRASTTHTHTQRFSAKCQKSPQMVRLLGRPSRTHIVGESEAVKTCHRYRTVKQKECPRDRNALFPECLGQQGSERHTAHLFRCLRAGEEHTNSGTESSD